MKVVKPANRNTRTAGRPHRRGAIEDTYCARRCNPSALAASAGFQTLFTFGRRLVRLGFGLFRLVERQDFLRDELVDAVDPVFELLDTRFGGARPRFRGVDPGLGGLEFLGCALEQHVAARLSLLSAFLDSPDGLGGLTKHIERGGQISFRTALAVPLEIRTLAAMQQRQPSNLIKMIELIDILVHVHPPGGRLARAARIKI